jgi:predicted SAM-dependent methyltransferase
MTTAPRPAGTPEPLRLHIGGEEKREGWKILNAQPGPSVDFVGKCDDLSQFADGSVDEIYASHVLEHLSYMDELPRTLYEVSRVMKVGGVLRMAVPDLDVLCRFMTVGNLPWAQKFHVMRMIYGGQIDPYDFHKVGYTAELLAPMLDAYCFEKIERVPSFGMFQDCSELKLGNYSISLNVQAVRKAGAPPKQCPWHPPGYEYPVHKK